MKKKILAFVLASAMALSLASCGGSKADAPAADNSGDAVAQRGCRSDEPWIIPPARPLR